jgi:hypothetical protein
VRVRPRARRCEPCFAIRRLPLPLLLQRLSGVRAFSRPTGRAGPGGRNGHLPDAARALESHSRHGRPTSLRLSDRGVLRWYTDCCRTPIANGAGAGFPIISMIHSFVDHDAGGHSSDEVFGPAALPYLRGLCNRAAPVRGAATAVTPGLRPSRIEDAQVVGARLARPSPFFDDSTNTPCSVPRVLTQSEPLNASVYRDYRRHHSRGLLPAKKPLASLSNKSPADRPYVPLAEVKMAAVPAPFNSNRGLAATTGP